MAFSKARWSFSIRTNARALALHTNGVSGEKKSFCSVAGPLTRLENPMGIKAAEKSGAGTGSPSDLISCRGDFKHVDTANGELQG